MEPKTKKRVKENLMMTMKCLTLMLGVVLSANILFGAITLTALKGYNNWYFWSTVVGASGLIMFICFLFIELRDWFKKGQEEKNG